jgi:hypothetical protein
MPATGTVLGAIGGYLTSLEVVQRVRSSYSSVLVSPVDPDVEIALRAVLEAAATDLSSILDQLAACRTLEGKSSVLVVDSLLSVLPAVLEETRGATGIGTLLPRTVAWVSSIASVVSAAVSLYRAWPSDGPALLSPKAAQQAQALFDARLGGDAKNLFPGPESGCGVLDTPIGSAIGLLVGVGFGWAGMRWLMRL